MVKPTIGYVGRAHLPWSGVVTVVIYGRNGKKEARLHREAGPFNRNLYVGFCLTDSRHNSGYGQYAIQLSRTNLAIGCKAFADLDSIGARRQIRDHEDQFRGLVLLDGSHLGAARGGG